MLLVYELWKHLLIGAYIILIGAAHSENYIFFTGLEPYTGSDTVHS